MEQGPEMDLDEDGEVPDLVHVVQGGQRLIVSSLAARLENEQCERLKKAAADAPVFVPRPILRGREVVQIVRGPQDVIDMVNQHIRHDW
jgi:hypothetical protein